MSVDPIVNCSGKVVAVAGGLGLIGAELSIAFERAGATVLVLDIDEAKFGELKTAGRFRQQHFLDCDLTRPASIEQILAQIVKRFNRIDTWVNCSYPHTPDWATPEGNASFASWDENIRMHLGGYAWSSQLVLEQMKKQGSGCLINFGSIYGVVGPHSEIYNNTAMTMPPAYAAIKGAIVNLTRYFAAVYGAFNIRINTVCPGGVFNGQDARFVDRYNGLTPLKRMARAEEIALPTVFLASDAASYITGHTLMVDGGWTAW